MANTPDIWRDMDRPFSTLGTWRPLLRQLDDFFNDAMSVRSDDGMRSMIPQCDVEETEDHYLLSFDMPGIERDKIDIEMQGNQLMVSGERRTEQRGESGRSRFIERRYGSFRRSVMLPSGVQQDGIEAQYIDGVLKVAVPKSPEAKRQKIKIGEGKGGIFSRLADKLSPGKDSVDVKSSDRKGEEMRH